MKILITTDLNRSTINGVVTSVLNLEEELEKRGHEVRILTLSDTGRAYREGNTLYLRSVPSGIYPGVRLPVSRGNDFVRELIGWKPDIVHSQCEFFTYGYARRIARETGAVLVHTCHTLYEQYTKYIPIAKHLGAAALSGWMRFRLRDADVLIAPTKKVEQTLRSYQIERPIAVIPTGISLERFSRSVPGEELARLREKCGIPKGARLVLSLGRLGFEKRVEELLLGWKQAGLSEEEAILLIVGDGPARESLQGLCRELGLEKKVRFFGMAAPWRVPSFYQMADAFVCASTSETQGLTYAEALASGLPLICREDPCLEGVLQHGKNGFAYGTIEELGGYLRELLDSGEMRSRMGAMSRRISEGFGTERFGCAVQALYQKEMHAKEVRQYEGSALCEKPASDLQKWDWTGYANAKRLP